MPIKIVNINTSLESKVKIGDGPSAAIAARVVNKRKPDSEGPILRVLLDSGSNGDLMFMHEGIRGMISYKERYSPQKWRTSSGTFITQSAGSLELSFPDYWHTENDVLTATRS